MLYYAMSQLFAEIQIYFLSCHNFLHVANKDALYNSCFLLDLYLFAVCKDVKNNFFKLNYL